MTQAVDEPTGRGVLLDQVLINRDGLIGYVKVEGSLGCSDHKMLEFKIPRGGSRAKSRTATLNFKTANFDLFRDLTGGIPWARTLEGKGVEES